VRYAVTGAYNPDYCDEAGKALGLGGLDAADGKVDCKVSAASTGLSDREAEEMTNALQDWARLPSIRDVAIAGATGIAAAFDDFTVAQDYLGYLSHPFSSFSTQYRGKPDRVGYFSISVCSSRKYDDGTKRFGFITPSACRLSTSLTFPSALSSMRAATSNASWMTPAGRVTACASP